MIQVVFTVPTQYVEARKEIQLQPASTNLLHIVKHLHMIS